MAVARTARKRERERDRNAAAAMNISYADNVSGMPVPLGIRFEEEDEIKLR